MEEIIKLYNGVTRYVWLSRIYMMEDIDDELRSLEDEGEDTSMVDSDYVRYSPEMTLKELILAK